MYMICRYCLSCVCLFMFFLLVINHFLYCSLFFSYGAVTVRVVTSSMIVFMFISMFMLYDMSTGEKLKKVLMYVLSSQGQEISMVLYSCCNSAKYMFIISHRGQVKETADVSAVISKVSNIHFTLSFSTCPEIMLQ